MKENDPHRNPLFYARNSKLPTGIGFHRWKHPHASSFAPVCNVLNKKYILSWFYYFSPRAAPGDVLVLTKPLGTQVAVNTHQWKEARNERWRKLVSGNQITEEQINLAYQEAMFNMSKLNKTGMWMLCILMSVLALYKNLKFDLFQQLPSLFCFI